MKDNTKSITFIGTPSGDGECFCWEVSQETFKEITGEKPDKYDSILHNHTPDSKRAWLYPDQIIDALKCDRDSKMKFTITVTAEVKPETAQSLRKRDAQEDNKRIDAESLADLKNNLKCLQKELKQTGSDEPGIRKDLQKEIDVARLDIAFREANEFIR